MYRVPRAPGVGPAHRASHGLQDLQARLIGLQEEWRVLALRAKANPGQAGAYRRCLADLERLKEVVAAVGRDFYGPAWGPASDLPPPRVMEEAPAYGASEGPADVQIRRAGTQE